MAAVVAMAAVALVWQRQLGSVSMAAAASLAAQQWRQLQLVDNTLLCIFLSLHSFLLGFNLGFSKKEILVVCRFLIFRNTVHHS
jgi:uncharacterized membrane protein (Fun14 family)